jgi:hypothetical protein
MIIHMNSVGGRRTSLLAGAPAGRVAFAALLTKTIQEPLTPELLYLDFAGVDTATASFLRESVLKFRDTVRMQRSNLYPIVANANEQVMEELTLLIQASGDVVMTCTIDERGDPSHPALLGSLDPKQKLTFELVNRIGETDAAELMRNHNAGDRVQQTAWNNRLSALAEMGLVFELSQGRAKRYRRLFEGDADGN